MMEVHEMPEENFHRFKPIISDTVKIKGNGLLEVGPFTVIEDYVLIDTSRGNPDSGISIGKRSKIKRGVVLRTYDGYIKIGDRVSIGEYSIIAGHGGVEIGDYTMIAGHAYISAANHIYLDDGVMRFQGETAKGIYIGKNVWIGGSVMITDGLRIGDGCVIGAGAVVTEDLPSNTICIGVPCKPIKKREKSIWEGNNMVGGS